MPNPRIVEQVHGILARAEIRFVLAADRNSYLVPVPHGSAAVLIAFHDWGRDQTMISMEAEVLVELEVTEENRLEILEHINALNQTSLFGRFYLDADRATVVLQYDLLGDELDGDELVNALFAVGVLADQTDDELLHEFGTGKRESDVDADGGLGVGLDDGAAPWTDPRRPA